MAVTLVDACKLAGADEVRTTLVETFTRTSGVLDVLPFETINGSAYVYPREGTLGSTAFRGVNASYTESAGTLDRLTEPLAICGGDLDVDTFIISTQGDNTRAQYEMMKAKSLARAWEKKFFKGAKSTAVAEYDGLQVRCDSTTYNKIANGTTDGGDALSLAKLDEAIDMCRPNPTHIFMNKTMRRRLSAAARTTTVGGNIYWEKDEFGSPILYYANLPIIAIDQDETGTDILPFTEVGYTGSTATASSIYVCSLNSDGVIGIQSSLPSMRDLGEYQASPVYRTRVEWMAAIAVLHRSAAVRLYGVKNAAVTA